MHHAMVAGDTTRPSRGSPIPLFTSVSVEDAWGMQGAADHGHHGGMPMAGMVDAAALNEIQSARGSSFDVLWMTSMISHHQGAITMAQAEIAEGENSDAIELARMIISAQQREIAQINHLLSVTE